MFVFWCLTFCAPLTSQTRRQRWGNAKLHSALLKYAPPLPNFVGCWHLADTESNTNRSDKVKHHSFFSFGLIMFPLKLQRCDGAADLYSACCRARPLHSTRRRWPPLIFTGASGWILNRTKTHLWLLVTLKLRRGFEKWHGQAAVAAQDFYSRPGWDSWVGGEGGSWEAMHRHCLILLLMLRRMQRSVFAGDRVETAVCSVGR